MIPPRISTPQTSDFVSSFPFVATENFHFLSRNGAIVHLFSGRNPVTIGGGIDLFAQFRMDASIAVCLHDRGEDPNICGLTLTS